MDIKQFTEAVEEHCRTIKDIEALGSVPINTVYNWMHNQRFPKSIQYFIDLLTALGYEIKKKGSRTNIVAKIDEGVGIHTSPDPEMVKLTALLKQMREDINCILETEEDD